MTLMLIDRRVVSSLAVRFTVCGFLGCRGLWMEMEEGW